MTLEDYVDPVEYPLLRLEYLNNILKQSTINNWHHNQGVPHRMSLQAGR